MSFDKIYKTKSRVKNIDEIGFESELQKFDNHTPDMQKVGLWKDIDWSTLVFSKFNISCTFAEMFENPNFDIPSHIPYPEPYPIIEVGAYK